MATCTRKPTYAGRRGRGAILAALATLMAMLVASISAAPAQAVNGVGSASARGTAFADLSTNGNVPAQFSAITNCDAAQSTRPFIVRWAVDSTTYTFRKTSTDTSTCDSAGDINENLGSGAGLVNGTPGAIVAWVFDDGSAVPGPDGVQIQIITNDPASGDIVSINTGVGGIDPLNGTPGGVWVFGDLPWPPL